MSARSVWSECQSRVIEPRNNDRRWSLRSQNSGGSIETPQMAWRGDPTGVREQGKGNEGLTGNLRDPSDFFPAKEPEQRGETGLPTPQAQREETPKTRSERKLTEEGK
jgi:hypothetical protein